MIYHKKGSLLTIPADMIICPVSKDGIIGYGISREIFFKYPNTYDAYQKMCNKGNNIAFEYDRDTEQWICYFATKNKATEPANIDCIAESLNTFVKYGFPSDVTFSFPKLGYFKIISLGISMKLPEGYEAYVVPRSSTFKTWGVIQANGVGIIDNSYSGTNDIWRFPAYATRDTKIKVNDRLCSLES